MYNVPSTARYLGYCEKGWPPVRISNRIPVTTGDARLQKVASAKVTPAGHSSLHLTNSRRQQGTTSLNDTAYWQRISPYLLAASVCAV